MRRAAVCLVSMALTGCGMFQTTSPSDSRSGLKYLGARAELTTPKGNTTFDLDDGEGADLAFNALFENEQLCGNYPKKTPRERAQFSSAAAVSILIAASSAAIDYWRAQQKKKLDDRFKASKGESEAQIVISPDQFKSGKCIVFRRRAEDVRADPKANTEDKFDLVVVLRIDRAVADDRGRVLADHFSLKPIFVRAANSIAQTYVNGNVDLAVGITLHQMVNDQGIPSLAKLGVAATAIPAVPLTGDAQCVRAETANNLLEELFGNKDKCRSTGILPLPTNGGTIVLGIGVQELGDLGFDVDLAKAQVDAVGAALGPLSGSLIQGHFDRAKVRDEK